MVVSKMNLKALTYTLACALGFGAAGVSFAGDTAASSAPSSLSAGLEVITTGKGYGHVSSSPGGINCYIPRPNVNYLLAPDCSEPFATAQNIMLTAHTDFDSAFMGWEGACSGLSKTCALAVSPLALTTVRAQYMRTIDLGDCLFNWLETHFPAQVAPRGARTESTESYHFRHYAGTGSYLGVSMADGHIYFLPAGGPLLDLGDAAAAGVAAACR